MDLQDFDELLLSIMDWIFRIMVVGIILGIIGGALYGAYCASF